jgi:predicted molibdopterin-dependent oxidoreductase YjgC
MDASSQADQSHSFRIDDQSVTRGKEVSIFINDKKVNAFEGESVAAVMMVDGHVAMRTTIEGEPRGIFCGMGVCFDCLVVVDDVPNTRACMTWVKAGMRIKSQKGLSA